MKRPLQAFGALLTLAACATSQPPSVTVRAAPRRVVTLGDVQKLVATPGERATIEVVTTYGYGCSCPPFKLSEDDSDSDDAYLLPVSGGGGLPPAILDVNSLGRSVRFELTGRFTGRRVPLGAWTKASGEDPPSPEMDEGGYYWQTAHPEFEVTSWCVRVTGEPMPAPLGRAPRCQ